MSEVDREKVWFEFRNTVDIKPSSLTEWLGTDESKPAG